MKDQEESVAGGKEGVLLKRILKTIHRLPDQERALNMTGTHLSAVRKGLECRGDPFGKEDVLLLAGKGGLEVRIPVSDLPVSCGRGSDADRMIDDARASRIHFYLKADKPFIFIEDAGTTNGTMLNGRRIGTPVYLAEGDEIVVGETVLTVCRG